MGVAEKKLWFLVDEDVGAWFFSDNELEESKKVSTHI